MPRRAHFLGLIVQSGPMVVAQSVLECMFVSDARQARALLMEIRTYKEIERHEIDEDVTCTAMREARCDHGPAKERSRPRQVPDWGSRRSLGLHMPYRRRIINSSSFSRPPGVHSPLMIFSQLVVKLRYIQFRSAGSRNCCCSNPTKTS